MSRNDSRDKSIYCVLKSRFCGSRSGQLCTRSSRHGSLALTFSGSAAKLLVLLVVVVLVTAFTGGVPQVSALEVPPDGADTPPVPLDIGSDSPAGTELALHYTFGSDNLLLVLSENGFLHAYTLEGGKLAWSADVGGDMIAVEVDVPPSPEIVLRDPLALPFLVRGNSLFTRMPFYTYNPAPSSTLDTAELLGNLPDYLRPYFFMNISTLLRRQTVFFGGTDIFVTSSVEVADLDSSTGRHVQRRASRGAARGSKRRGGRQREAKAKGGEPERDSFSTTDTSSSSHNELTPVLHVVRYNIVLHVVKADEYSWSITLSQLQLSPHASPTSLYSRHARDNEADVAELEKLKEQNAEEYPRFFSHLMRDLFDYDAAHAPGRPHSGESTKTTHAEEPSSSSSSSSSSAVPSTATAASIVAALQRRRTQLAQYVSGVLSLEQHNASHVRLLHYAEGTTAWTANLPSLSRPAPSTADSDDETETSAERRSFGSADAIASYVWVCGADSIFRLPVQRAAAALDAGDPAEVMTRGSGGGVYAAADPVNHTGGTLQPARLTASALSGAVIPLHGSYGGLPLMPLTRYKDDTIATDGAALRHATMAMDVEADEREGDELDRYYYERSWWESQTAAGGSPGAAVYNAGHPFASFTSPGADVRAGLAWRTAGIISFHVLCLAGSIAFLCAGVPPRNQLQRAWAQADRNRDRLSHTSVSLPQSMQLKPQDMAGGQGSPLGLVMDGFSVDGPALGAMNGVQSNRIGLGAAPLPSPSQGRLERGATLDSVVTPQKWDDPTPEEVYAMMREEAEQSDSAARNGAAARSSSRKLSAVQVGTDSTASTNAANDALTSSSLRTTATTNANGHPSLDSFAEKEPFIDSTGQEVTDQRNGAPLTTLGDAAAAADASASCSDDDSEEIDMGERWWLRAQHRPRLPSVATAEETLSDKGSSVSHSPVHNSNHNNNNNEEEGKLFQLHFKVLEKVGFGGEGSVFCVEHRVTHARYAIKAILIHEQDEERVVQEAVLHSSFDHANVVRFYFCWIEDIAVSTADQLQLCNFGGDGMDTMSLGLSARSLPTSSPTEEDTLNDETMDDDSMTGDTYHMLFIQMEFFARGTLADWLRTRKGFYRLEVLRYMQHIADGLAYLHNQDVVHRDLKPTNIFVSSSNVLKIGDFGLAKRRVTTGSSNGDLASNVAGGQQERSIVGGSPLYCSPEQTRGDAVNKPSDIFSLGIIAVEMLCTFATLHERIRILTDARQGVLPAETEAEFPEEAQIIRPLLAADPQQRPSLRKLQRQLTRLIDALEDSERDADELVHSPAETIEPSHLPQPLPLPGSYSGGRHAMAAPSTQTVSSAESLPALRRSSTAQFTPTATALPTAQTDRQGAEEPVAVFLQDPLHESSSSPRHAGEASAASLSAWSAMQAVPAAAMPRSIPRPQSSPVAQPPVPARHRNSYHDRRYTSGTSSPGAEAAAAAAANGFSSSETASHGADGASAASPADHIVSDPYGMPAAPVTYSEDADLSSILKRDLQDRTISPPD